MRLSILLVPAVAIAALAPGGAHGTDFCNGNGTVYDVFGQVYVAVDAVLTHGYLFSIWVYCESNGEPGLQRGGVTLFGDADLCQDSSNPDSNCLFGWWL